MRLSRSILIAQRELQEAMANRLMMVSLAFTPLMLVLGPLPLLASDVLVGRAPRSALMPLLGIWSRTFLMLPVIVPLAIGAQSVVGERERRTIEPLLAAPIEATEIVLGKMLAAIVPGLLITWAAYGAFCLLVNWYAYPVFHEPLVPDRSGLIMMFVLAPTVAVLGNGLVVAVSARVGDARLANQLSGLLVLPLMGMTIAPAMAGVALGPTFDLAAAGLLLVADVSVFALAVRLFDRERLISTVK